MEKAVEKAFIRLAGPAYLFERPTVVDESQICMVCGLYKRALVVDGQILRCVRCWIEREEEIQEIEKSHDKS